MSTETLVSALKGDACSIAEATEILDAWLDARLEQAMPKILGALRHANIAADVCTCGHEKQMHLTYFGECYRVGCKCRRFLSEQRKT